MKGSLRAPQQLSVPRELQREGRDGYQQSLLRSVPALDKYEEEHHLPSWLSLIVVWNVVIFPVNGDPDAMMLVVLPISSCVQLSTQIVSLFSLLANGRFVLGLGLWRLGRRTKWWHLAAEDGHNGN